jgi:hypothetical protein
LSRLGLWGERNQQGKPSAQEKLGAMQEYVAIMANVKNYSKGRAAIRRN